MRTGARELDEALASATTPEDRLAWFGALLARETGVEIELVGGAAITLYLTSQSYVSEDIDVVGPREPIVRVLRRWGFRQVEGRSGRTYWMKKGIGLVDLVGPADRSGLAPVLRPTPYGPVSISAVEPLILRRLLRATREGSEELYNQAVGLANGRDLDWDYLLPMAKYEAVQEGLRRLRSAIRPRAP